MPWFCRQWPGFRHAFTFLPEETLDPLVIGYSPRPSEPRAARQHLQRSAPRAPQRMPRFSMVTRRTAYPSSGLFLSKEHRPSLLRSGVAGLFEHVDPRLGDRSPWRIYPNLTNSNTPVASPCRSSSGRRRGSTILRYGSLSDGNTRFARQAQHSYEDRSAKPLAKGSSVEPHPGCLPPREPTDLAIGRWSYPSPDESTDE